MTVKNYKKVFRQLEAKPAKLIKYKKHNTPKEKKTGKGKNRCRVCGTTRGMIGSYGLKLCRRCFRDMAKEIGFKKYD
jgi:ribosomal protein S14